MFLQYYGLREQPFGVTPNPRYLYHSPAHREALASLIYGIEADLGFAALIADPGMGKTTLLFYLLEKFRSTARTALVFQTQCNAVELLRYVANELDVPADEDDPVVLFDRIRDVLVRDARSGRRVIVIIDEAQNLSEEALEAIRLLSDFETPEFKLLHIILAGQPPLAEKLARPSMAQLLQRIAMLNRLVPFTEIEDVSKYIAYRLKVAGYSGPALFNNDALELIAKQSRGVPRQINRLCFNALSIGCATKKRVIDGDIVREVISDLDVASLLGKSGSEEAERPALKSGEASAPRTVSQGGGIPDEPGTRNVARQPEITYPAAVAPPLVMPVAASVASGASAAEMFVEGALALSPAYFPDVREAVRPKERMYPTPRHAPEPPSRGNGKSHQAVPPVLPKTTTTAPPVARKVTPAPVKAQKAAPRPMSQGEGRSLAFIVLCVVAVPLLVLAAWLYLEKQHMLPGAQPSAPTTEQSTPNSTEHGDAVTLPQAADPGPQQPKSSKSDRGKRSELQVVPFLHSGQGSIDLAGMATKLFFSSGHLT